MTATEVPKAERARAYLHEWLSDGPRAAREIEALISETDISSRTFDDAKAELSIESRRIDDQWVWVPVDATVTDPPPEQPDESLTSEREGLEQEQAKIEAELSDLEARLPDLALDDPDAFHAANTRCKHLQSEFERLTYALDAHDKRMEERRRQREADERARLEAHYEMLSKDARAKLAAIRTGLAEIAPMFHDYRQTELERQRLARILGRPAAWRADQLMEGVIYSELGVGDGRQHRKLVDAVFPQEQEEAADV